ncbi:Hemolysin, contains CBS domains [Verrucomicrobium sp. GAS474]|uniref:hemolysin family protein n=1 Tax=Verrucomicrobium sp. GAS474 TaxID=1882831 RepID=UPI00087BDAC7|nr:hemolysin family protein [Verrucomicrobium sp. GAS474]SDT99254.1 Hemolysin, contains CBS domains [Verrucomicrobium sp. GAS474]
MSFEIPPLPPHVLRDTTAMLLLIFANGYFVATEFAMVRVRATQLRPLVKAGDWRARIAYRVTQNLDRFISAVQLGVTFMSLALGWLGEPLVASVVDPWLAPIIAYIPFVGDHGDVVYHVLSFLAAFGITSSLHIVLGELVPKTVALHRPRSLLLWFTPPLLLFYYVFFPLIWVLKTMAGWILLLLGVKSSKEEHGFSPEELQDVLATSSHAHPSDVLINQIMIKALRLKETTAEQVMVPRENVAVLWRDAPLMENLNFAQRSGYSRLPVCGLGKGDIVGVLMVKELLWQYTVLGNQTEVEPLVRPALTFLPKTKLPTMLELFRKSRNHLAVVLDAQDRMVGIVCFEDVLEELVGDIRDEFDIEKGPFYELSESAALVDAGMLLRDLANETGWPIQAKGRETVREWAIAQFGHPPSKRAQTDVADPNSAIVLRLIAEEVGAQGLRRLRLLKLKPAEEAGEE